MTEMPPGFAFGMPPGFRTPEQEEFEKRAREFTERATRAEQDMRRQVIAHAWLLCSCRKWYDRAQPDKPPQADCLVHGNMIITPSGEVL